MPESKLSNGNEPGMCEHWHTPVARSLIKDPLGWNQKICRVERKVCPVYADENCRLIPPQPSSGDDNGAAPLCKKCGQPMPWRSLKTKKPVCMICPVIAAGSWIKREHANELVPIKGWAHISDRSCRFIEARSMSPDRKRYNIPCKIMIARKHLEKHNEKPNKRT